MHHLKITNSKLPLTEILPGGFTVGSQLIIQGSTHSNTDRLTIYLECGPKNIIFHVTVDFVFEICRYAYYSTRNVSWSVDRSHGEISLVLGQPFIIYITFDRFHFTVRSNQRKVYRFSHRLPMSKRITHLTIDGSAIVREIRLNNRSFITAPRVEDQPNAPLRLELLSEDSEEKQSPNATKANRQTETLRTPKMSRVFRLRRMLRLPKVLSTLRLPKVLKMIRMPKMFSMPKLTKRPHNPSVISLLKMSYMSETPSLNPFFLQIVK